MNSRVHKSDFLLQKCLVYCRLGRINEAMSNWKMAYELSNNKTDKILLDVRKQIHLMADDVLMLQFLDIIDRVKRDVKQTVAKYMMETLAALGNNDRRKAVELIEKLIISNQDNPEACELLYYFKALCYKHILTFKKENVDEVLNGLRGTFKKYKGNVIRRMQIAQSYISTEIQFGRYKEAMACIERVEKGLNDTDQRRRESIAFDLSKVNIHASKGEYGLAKELLKSLLEYSENQLKVHAKELLVYVKNFREVIASSRKTNSVYRRNYIAKWNIFLDYLSIYLRYSNIRYCAQTIENEFRSSFSLAADRELGPDTLHQCYNSLQDVSHQLLSDDIDQCNIFDKKFKKYINEVKFYLSILATNMHHSISRGLIEEEHYYMQKAKEYKANYFEIHIAEATSLLLRGQLERAKVSFDKAVDSVYTFQVVAANVYAERANYYTHVYDFKNAEADLNVALKAAPCIHLIYTEWGRLYFKMGKIKEAEDHFKTSIKMNGNDGRTYTTRASCYLDYHLFDKAFDDLEIVKGINCNEFTYLYHVSILFIRCRDYDNASFYASKAREANKEDCRSYILDSYIAYQRGFYAQSFRSLKIAEQKNPSDSRVFVMYAFLQKHRTDMPEDFFDRIHAIKNKSSSLNKANDFLLNALISTQKPGLRQLSDILRIARIVYLKSPQRFLVGKIIADYLMTRAKYRLAFIYYTRVIKIYPYDRSLSDDQKEALIQYQEQAFTWLDHLISSTEMPTDAEQQYFDSKRKEINERLALMKARVTRDAAIVHEAEKVLENLKEKCKKTFAEI